MASRTGNPVTWWTGDALLVWSTGNLTQRSNHCRWRDDAPVGPGVMMAGNFLGAGHRRDRGK
ncbi:hypothetical protein ABLO16_06695 [Mycobacterium tuberculosis]